MQINTLYAHRVEFAYFMQAIGTIWAESLSFLSAARSSSYAALTAAWLKQQVVICAWAQAGFPQQHLPPIPLTAAPPLGSGWAVNCSGIVWQAG